MKSIWENHWFFVPVVLFLGFSGILAIVVPYGQEILFFNDLRREPYNSTFLFFTYLGEFWAYLAFGLAALFWRPRYTLIIAFVGLLALPVTYLLKDAIGVDRPITFFEKKAAQAKVILVPEAVINRGQTSFPSGHTTSAFALFSLLSLMAGRRYAAYGLLFASLAILTGISRIFLAQHFLVDVLGGAVIGLLLSGLVWKAARRFLPDFRDGNTA